MKKYILIFSSIFTILLLISGIARPFKLCADYWKCMELNHSFFVTFSPILPVFIFSLITYFLSEAIFSAWYKFSRIYIPICIGLILITPEYGGGSFIYPIQKGSVAFYTSLLYFGISIIIILTKLYTTRGQK